LTVKKTRVHFIEVIDDSDLKKREKRVTQAVKRLCPDSGPVKLYRTADGQLGFQLQLRLKTGERKVLDDVYRTVMRVLGIKRGRRSGVKTVQTKLRLPEAVYRSLKKAASDSHATISAVVADLARRKLSGTTLR